jgi:hypothetical protein
MESLWSFFFYCEFFLFIYKGLHNYQFMACNNTNFYHLLIIGMYLNDPIFHFGNVLIGDQ